MNRSRPPIVAITLAAASGALLLLAACGGSDDADPSPAPTATATATATATPDADLPITVSAPTGSPSGADVSISIPTSALPADVSPSDVKIENITADDLAVSIEDADVVAAYRLLPDGLVLSEPATVTLRLPVAHLSGGLILIHLTDEGLSPIDDLIVTIDDAGEIATLEATITHFSDLTAMETRFFDIGLNLTEHVYKIGESFPVSVVVSSSGRGWGYRENAQGMATVKVAEPILLYGFWTGKAPALLPDLVNDRPSISGLEGSYTNTQTFTCAEETSGVSVVYRGTLSYFLEQQFLANDGTQTAAPIAGGGGEIAIFDQESIDCVLIPPIRAELAAPNTLYSLDIDPGSNYRFVWSGPDCGSVNGIDGPNMIWDHGSDDCDHAGEAHPDTTISVLVVGDDFEVRCTYQGAATGTGDLCEKEK